MPLYEFRCRLCAGLFSEHRPMSRSGDPASCPRCGGEGRRKYSLAGAFLEGAGFREDYYIAFGRHIGSKRELKAAMRELEIENETYTYEDIDIETGESTGETRTVELGMKLEAEAL